MINTADMYKDGDILMHKYTGILIKVCYSTKRVLIEDRYTAEWFEDITGKRYNYINGDEYRVI